MYLRAFSVFAALLLPAAFSAPNVQAETVKFVIDGPSGGRVLTLDSKRTDAGDFVSLQAIVEQAGGAYNAISTRLRVDIEGTTAWLRIGEPRVHALSIFTLRKAIKDDNGVAMIALEDVPDFFIKSFRVNARVAPEAGAITPAPQQPSTTMTTPSAPSAAPSRPAPQSAKEPPALEQLTTPIVAPGVSAIFIDAAHGGYDTGLQSAEKSTESAIVLAIATRVKKGLETAGRTNVILTRPDEKEVNAAQRAKFVRAEPGSIFVSLHLGSSLSPTAEGVAAYFPAPSTGSAPAGTAGALQPDARLSSESRRLAGNLGSALAQATGAPLRGVLEIPLKGLGDYQSPSAEVELGCMTSPADAQRLATNEYEDKLAAGIVTGIMAYLDNNSGTAAATSPVADPAAAAAPKAN